MKELCLVNPNDSFLMKPTDRLISQENIFSEYSRTEPLPLRLLVKVIVDSFRTLFPNLTGFSTVRLRRVLSKAWFRTGNRNPSSRERILVMKDGRGDILILSGNLSIANSGLLEKPFRFLGQTMPMAMLMELL